MHHITQHRQKEHEMPSNLFGPGRPTAKHTADALKERQDARRAEDAAKAAKGKK